MFIILIRHWEESRPSSRISGLLSSRHILIDCVYIGGYSVLRERLYPRNGVFKLYLLRHGRLNELFV